MSKIRVLLSNRYYSEKPDKAANIIKSAKTYSEAEVTPEDLWKYLKLGYYMHPVCGTSLSESSPESGNMTFKKSLVEFTHIVTVDLDYSHVSDRKYTEAEMPEWDDEILKLEFEGQDVTPTFWYRSYSYQSKKKDKGNNIHAMYVFDEPIPLADFEDVSLSVLYKFTKALESKGITIPKEKVIDTVCTDYFQGIWGGRDFGGFSGSTYCAKDFFVGRRLSAHDRRKAVQEACETVWGEVPAKFRRWCEIGKNVVKEHVKAKKATMKATRGSGILSESDLSCVDASKVRYTIHKDRLSWDEVWHMIHFLKWSYGSADRAGGSYSEMEDVERVGSTPYASEACDQPYAAPMAYKLCEKLILPHYREGGYDVSGLRRDYLRMKEWQDGDRYKWEMLRVIGETGGYPMDVSEPNIALRCERYLSEKFEEILRQLRKVSLLEARPGVGKTQFCKALPGKVLVVQMLNSIVKSSKFGDDWSKCFAERHIGSFRDHDKVVCVVDKLQKQGLEDLAGFDYVVVDESHMLIDSSEYRSPAMGCAVDRLKELAESKEFRGKIILMTGTPLEEKKLFPGLWHVKIIDGAPYKRSFTAVHSDDPETSLMDFVTEALKAGKKILFPINRSKRKELIIKKLKRISDVWEPSEDKVGEFSRANKDSDFATCVQQNSTVPDSVRIVTCTNYLSVGLDILDDNEWEVVFLDEFTAGQMIQFANRLRNKDLSVRLFTSDPAAPAYDRDGVMNLGLSTAVWLNMNAPNGVDRMDRPCSEVLRSCYDTVRFEPRTAAAKEGDTNGWRVDTTRVRLADMWLRYKSRHMDFEEMSCDFTDQGWTVASVEEVVGNSRKKARKAANKKLDAERKAKLTEEALRWLKEEAESEAESRKPAHSMDEDVVGLFNRSLRAPLRKLRDFTGDWSVVEAFARGLAEYKPLTANDLKNYFVIREINYNIEELSGRFRKFVEKTWEFVEERDLRKPKDIKEFLEAEAELYLDGLPDDCPGRDGLRDRLADALHGVFNALVVRRKENSGGQRHTFYELSLRPDELKLLREWQMK